MIYYLVTRQHAYTMETFLRSWGAALAGRVRIVPYDHVFGNQPVPLENASYVFSDLDRLTPEARDHLGQVHDYLARTCGAAHVLNDPRRFRTRLEALQAYQSHGINDFSAFRLSEDRIPERFPVFIRGEVGFEHESPALLRDAAAFRAARESLENRGARLAGHLVVEYRDTRGADGVYRKYGAFIVGERLIPRHVFFSRQWMVKLPDLGAPEFVAEEFDHLAADRHADVLRRVASLAGVEYGRIDYSLDGDRPLVWEVNTNPMIASEISAGIPARQATHDRFVARFVAALTAFDARRPHG